MPEQFQLELDQKRLKILDKHRGDLSREEYILKVLDVHVNSEGRINFSKLNELKSSDGEGQTSSEFSLLIDNFQEFAHDIYKRLDRLETLMNDQGTYSKTNVNENTGSEYNLELEDDEVEDDDDEDEKFDEDEIIDDDDEDEDDDEDKGYYLADDDDEDDDEDDEDDEIDYKAKTLTFESVDDEDTDDDSFEYGCPFCNATIDKNATKCGQCGKKFDDGSEGYTDFQDDYETVEPLSKGYTDTGEYDPRPNHVKRKEVTGYSGVSSGSYSDPPPQKSYEDMSAAHGKRVPGCSSCGKDLVFIKQYKRWYCYGCKKYSGSQVPGSTSAPPAPPPRDLGMGTANMGDMGPERAAKPTARKRRYKPDHQPLKGYHKYSKRSDWRI